MLAQQLLAWEKVERGSLEGKEGRQFYFHHAINICYSEFCHFFKKDS